MKPAQKILRGCEKCLKETVPPGLSFRSGFLFNINNSLAQLANRLGDVKLSVKYLEAAVDSTQGPQAQDTEELPLAETYLNIANAHAFLGKHEEALLFAEKANVQSTLACARIEKILSKSLHLK